MTAPLVDSFGRSISYLRLSVTDRCNLRCVYCLPVESLDIVRPSEPLLSHEEIVRLVRSFAGLGFSKIRITGGEPLVRPGIVDVVRAIAQVPGVADLSLSTNGVLLGPMAKALAQAGLQRVNISLDTLCPDRFREITRWGSLEQVLGGLEAAFETGMAPVKINVVVMRGMNEDEIPDFVHMTEDQPVHVRFIELMPMGATGFFSKARWVPLAEMMERGGGEGLIPLPPEKWPTGSGPAYYCWRPGARGTVGFISALSQGFCASCNRVRLSARGILVPCLDGEDGVDLLFALRAGASEEEIQALIRDAIHRKPEQHAMGERACRVGPVARAAGRGSTRLMCQIGG